MSMSRNLQRWIGGGAVAIALAIAVGIYMSGDEPSSGGADKSENAVELVSHEGKLEEGRPTRVEGIVRNTSGRELSRVKVKVTFYNAAGSLIGDTTAQTGGLGLGDEWQFEVPAVGDSAARYEIDRVTWR